MTDNQRSDTVFDAVIDNVSRGFVDVIPYPVVALNCQAALENQCNIHLLMLGNGRQVSKALVVLMVNAFEGFAVDNKRHPISDHPCRQIIKPKIDSHGDLGIDTDCFFDCLADVILPQKTSIIFRMDTDSLNRIGVKIRRKRNLDLVMFLFELRRHRYFPFTVFQPNPRHNQAEVAIFIKVFRQTKIVESVFTCLCLLDQIEKATEQDRSATFIVCCAMLVLRA